MQDIDRDYTQHLDETNTSIDQQCFMDMVKSLKSQPAGDVAMTLAQQHIQEGLEEVREEVRMDIVLCKDAPGMDIAQTY